MRSGLRGATGSGPAVIWNGVVTVREIRGVPTLVGWLTSDDPEITAPCYVNIEPPRDGQRESFGIWHQKLLVVGTKFTWEVGKNGDKVRFVD